MNDILQTLSCKTADPTVFDIHWLRNERHGCLKVKLNTRKQDDLHIIGELVAIQHLIVNRAICGTNRFGKNLGLVVSSGAIKKVCLGKSSKTHLDAWSDILKMRLRDAEIMVINSRDWINMPVHENEAITVSKPPCETIYMKELGPVRISEHALDRFCMRNQNATYQNAMKRIIKELADPDLHQIELPEKVLLRKKLKYPHSEHVQYYYNRRTNWQFVVDLKSGRQPVVLTAYPLNRPRVLH